MQNLDAVISKCKYIVCMPLPGLSWAIFNFVRNTSVAKAAAACIVPDPYPRITTAPSVLKYCKRNYIKLYIRTF